MSADFWHMVTVRKLDGVRVYRARTHRVDGGVLVLTNPVELPHFGNNPDPAAQPDWLIIPLDASVDSVAVTLVKRDR